MGSLRPRDAAPGAATARSPGRALFAALYTPLCLLTSAGWRPARTCRWHPGKGAIRCCEVLQRIAFRN